MFPIFPIVVAIFWVVYALCGMAIGALAGWAVSLVTKSGRGGIFRDALLGTFGYLAGFIGSIIVPWPKNTIRYQLEGGTEVVSTMNTYQHPERVAIALAVLLPVLHELYRWKKRSTA
jgi:uncharacterized membrane protein YeaQ/YmgE (transglycosylase-associated protein family)